MADDSVEVKWGDSASTRAEAHANSRARDQAEGEVQSTAVVLYAKVAVVRGAAFVDRIYSVCEGADDAMFVTRERPEVI